MFLDNVPVQSIQHLQIFYSLVIRCTSSCTSLFILLFIKSTVYCIAHFILLHILLIFSSYFYLYLYIFSCVMFHFFALSIERTCPDLHFTTDLSCIMEYVTNKRTLNLEPWCNNCFVTMGSRFICDHGVKVYLRPWGQGLFATMGSRFICDHGVKVYFLMAE